MTPSSPARARSIEEIRALLNERVPPASSVRPKLEDLWSLYAAMGWLSSGLDESHGADGRPPAEAISVFRELGRVLAPGPIVSSSVAIGVALAAGAHELAHSISAGEAVVGLAQPRDRDAVVDRKVAGRFQLVDSATADFVLVAGVDVLALVPANAAASANRLVCIDDWVELGEVEWSDAPTVAATREIGPLVERARLLTASILVGIAEATRDAAVAYAKERNQFGQPIGAFQAIKHRCADMAVQAEAARALLEYAAARLNEPESNAAATAAKIVAAGAALANARANIQIHGARGFSEEYPAHRYLKRSHVLDHTWGDQRALCADLVTQSPSATDNSSMSKPANDTRGSEPRPSSGALAG